MRYRVYKFPYHSGNIGEMKRYSASLARGKYVMEFFKDLSRISVYYWDRDCVWTRRISHGTIASVKYRFLLLFYFNIRL
jgi:hypothetical protein